MTTPPTTDGPKRTAGRKKQTTDAGRAILNRERRRMAREHAAESEEMVAEYRRQAEMRARRLNGAADPVRTTQRAIDRGLVKRVAGVLAAEDLTFTMQAHPSPDQKSSAWTDFKLIFIHYATFRDEKGEPDYRMIAANFRGLAYHEGGHIRWTVPFKNLVHLATGEETNRFDYLSKPWNILEDQRMETAVVSDAPTKARYFLPMVMEHNCPTKTMLAMNYPYIVWRKYLPPKLRSEGRKLFIASHPKVTDALCTEMEAIIQRYVFANSPVDMLDAVREFDTFWKAYITPSVPEDATHRTASKRDPEDLTNEMFDPPIDVDDDVDGGDVAGDAGAQDDGDGKGETESDSNGAGGKGAGNGDGEPEPEITDEDIHDMLAEAEEARNNDRSLDSDEHAMYEAAQEYGSTLPTYSTGVDTDTELQAQADNLAYEVENAFQAATMDRAPAWVEQQERGIVNVLRYTTREPGQIDFYRQWTDDEQPGFNMAVSVMLDYSGSMQGKEKELAAAGYAAKNACQRLNIPCTVTLWNSSAMLLWDHNDKADFLPVIKPAGGTNPTEALDDIFAQRFDKQVHVVLILTDGSWSTSTAFSDYRADGTFFVVLSYDELIRTANNRAAQVAMYGPDVSLGIDNLMQIPRILEQSLVDAVTMVR